MMAPKTAHFEGDKDMRPEAFLHRMQEMLGDEYEAFSAGVGRENFEARRVNPL